MKHRRTRIVNPKTCAVGKCSIVIASRFLMCLNHWDRVPRGLRLRVWAALSQWENDPSSAAKLETLRALQAEAITAVS
jgi:hypothetical protein